MVDITGVIYETGVANPSRSHFLLLFFVCANLCCLSICFFYFGHKSVFTTSHGSQMNIPSHILFVEALFQHTFCMYNFDTLRT